MQYSLFNEPINAKLNAALNFIRTAVERGESPGFMGSTGPGEGVQIGGYVADPLPWDHSRPLRKLKPGEIAVWEGDTVEYFQYAELAKRGTA